MKLVQIKPKILSFAKREQFNVKAIRTRHEAASVDDPLKKYPPCIQNKFKKIWETEA